MIELDSMMRIENRFQVEMREFLGFLGCIQTTKTEFGAIYNEKFGSFSRTLCENFCCKFAQLLGA